MNPLPGYRFVVTLDASDAYTPPNAEQLARVAAGAFSDVNGLSGELEVLAHQEGGRNDFVHQLPVRHSWGRITLKRGITQDRSLFDWYRSSLNGPIGARRDGAIVLYDTDGDPAVTWHFTAGIAAKWVGPELNAKEGAIAIEALEIAHHGVTQILAGA